ncbi:cysteine desulfurase family protein [Actinosynnema sp. NPDC047251]|uniref:cysteine desulfurase n=1 Tax=Saccharothrix espanaensis (strain ATCC 51144 / DSM 44229 / JCM 9112 / NBRC 15066 / NRRL 15764) TaxID=1179773 RepID=K0K0F1_SACES|nr:cysteine desulfurase family protein [Saccharothrix espanaensis]CCH31816.1 Cysteine desulfurase [Saccharothrix espanaensis DSM 44229]
MHTVYLDNCATTRCRDEVVEVMLPLLGEQFGNPSSAHVMGRLARREVDRGVAAVARFVNADPAELTITSGATESNNLVMLGAFELHERAPANVVTSPLAHKSTLEVAKELARRGVEVRTAPVSRSGQVDLRALRGLVDDNTRLVTVDWVNSEIGTVQDVPAIAEVCRAHDTLLHVDAVQAAGRIPIDVAALGVDALSLSAHKVYGPKGIGALYVRASRQHRIRPLSFGGGQNRLRSGTLPTHLIVGFARACDLARQELAANTERARWLRQIVCDRVFAAVPGAKLNNDPEVSVPHIINVSFPGVTGESLVSSLSKVAISTGSACNSTSLQPSHVLKGIGLDDADANSAVRISLDPTMDEADLRYGLDVLCDRVLALRQEF